MNIGALLSLSGSFASPSKDMLDGMQLALDRTNTFGGRPVSFLVRDDQGKPELAVEEANRLVSSEHVDFITGVGLSSVLLATYRPILASETFLVGSNSGLDALAGKNCSPFFFSASFQNGQSSQLMGAYLTQQNIDNVFVLAPNYQGGKDAVAGFKRGYKGTVAGEIYTPMQQTDFSAEISRVRAAKPGAVFVFYPGTWGVQWIKQYSEAGLTSIRPTLLDLHAGRGQHRGHWQGLSRNVFHQPLGQRPRQPGQPCRSSRPTARNTAIRPLPSPPKASTACS